jgi:membrane protease YdiL (CAAX protease family)
MEIESAVEATPQRVGAGRGCAIFVLFNVAQFVVAIAGLIVAAITAVVRDINAEQATKGLEPFLLAPAALGGAFVLYILLRNWAPLWWREQRADGFGWARLSGRRLAIAAVCGAAIAAVFIAVAMRFPPADPSQLGPLAQLARRGGLARALLVIVAILIAPPVEEVLFRGLLLDGFTESWGFVPAAIVVTLLFVSLHFFDIYRYWPSAAAIAVLAVGTLIVRLRMRSIAAAMILHAVYNAGVTVGGYLS